MRLLLNITKVFTFLTIITLTSCKAQYSDLDDGLYAEFITDKGTMVAKLTFEETPVTVANFVSLAEGKNNLVDSLYKKKKYYNQTIFHRVIDQFMIQGGDPTGSGTGQPGYKFNDEFSPNLKHDKPGILSMANSGPNTNGSQFFITEVPTPHLDNKHSVFGELVIGLDVLDSISNVKTGERDAPLENIYLNELNIIRKGKSAKKFNAPKTFENYVIEAQRIEQEKNEKLKTITTKTIEKFKNQRERATSLPSGLQYYISKKGNGEKLPENATVLTHYSLYFEDGMLLDTSKIEDAEAYFIVNKKRKQANLYKPLQANIGPDARMIPGFKEGLQQLNIGDKATLFIPYHLAYGDVGNRDIPAKTNLIFEVEILELVN
ncbi:MAG: peptidylprolyl isomerase [Aestuariibaculum sp.]